MILRIWHTQVDKTRLKEYAAFEQTHSLPMFKQLAGCLGVFFLRTDNGCAALSLWEDMAAIEALTTNSLYQETVEKLVAKGLLRGEQTVEIYEAEGGFMGDIQTYLD